MVDTNKKTEIITTSNQSQVPNTNNNEANIAPKINNNTDEISAKDFIKQAKAENQAFEEDQAEKTRKKQLVVDVINSCTDVDVEVSKNIITNEVIDEKRTYRKNRNGKSIYDYMADEEVNSIIGFTVPEADKNNKFGDRITGLISTFIKKPQYL